MKNAGFKNLEKQLAALIEGDVTLIGIGNPLRGDDAAGSMAARQIAVGPGVCVIDAQEVPEDYVQQVVNQPPDTIVLIDSVDLNSAPGSVALLEPGQIAAYWPNTHRMPISMLMAVLEHETHARVFAIGIQPAQTVFLQPMSDPVTAAVTDLTAILGRVLASRVPAHEASA